MFAKDGKRCRENLCVGVCPLYILNEEVQRKEIVEIRKIIDSNDTLPMSYTVFDKPDQGVVYFGGKTVHIIVGLGGSIEHLIGSKPTEKNNLYQIMPNSSLAVIGDILLRLYSLESHGQLRQPNEMIEFYLKRDNAMLEAAEFVTTHSLKASEQQLEFLAKTLKQGTLGKDTRYVIIGTPIYVAIDD